MPDDGRGRNELGYRVLMLAPTVRDAAMAKSILAHSGIVPAVF